MLDRNLVKFGLIGCGRIGATSDESVSVWPNSNVWLPYSHAAAICATNGGFLKAVCDFNLNAAKSAANRYQVENYYNDYKEMLRTECLEVVSIATRTTERCSIILEAIKHGVRAIYCEKPLANTLEETDLIINSLEKNAVGFVYGTKRRYMPLFQRLKERITVENKIGNLKNVTIRYGVNAPLLWTLPHAVDMALFFAQDDGVRSVFARLDLDRRDIQGQLIDSDPNLIFAEIQFNSGFEAILIQGGGMDVEIHGDKGSLYIESDGRKVCWRTNSDQNDLGWMLHEEIEYPSNEHTSGTQTAMQLLVNSIKNSHISLLSPRSALLNQEILFGFVESHLTARSVLFPVERKGTKITGRFGSLYA